MVDGLYEFTCNHKKMTFSCVVGWLTSSSWRGSPSSSLPRALCRYRSLMWSSAMPDAVQELVPDEVAKIFKDGRASEHPPRPTRRPRETHQTPAASYG